MEDTGVRAHDDGISDDGFRAAASFRRIEEELRGSLRNLDGSALSHGETVKAVELALELEAHELADFGVVAEVTEECREVERGETFCTLRNDKVDDVRFRGGLEGAERGFVVGLVDVQGKFDRAMTRRILEGFEDGEHLDVTTDVAAADLFRDVGFFEAVDEGFGEAGDGGAVSQPNGRGDPCSGWNLEAR